MHLADLTDAEWEKAIGAAIRQEKFFPPVATLRELAGPSAIETRSKAAASFEILAEWWYSRHGLTKFGGAERGDIIDREKVLEKLGPVVYEAMMIAGGPSAFENMRDSDRPFLLKRFEDAFREADVEYRRTGELPAARDSKRLPPKLRELVAGVGREMPKAVKS